MADQDLEAIHPDHGQEPVSAGGVSSEPAGGNVLPVAGELEQALRRVEAAARDWGIRPELMEGQFVSALLVAIRHIGRVSVAARAEFRELFRQNREVAAEEYAKARELHGAAQAGLRQARQIQLSLVAEQENVTLRMIKETLPMFVERLQKVLVIREQRWNADLRRRRYALAGAVALAVFLSGYALSAWEDSDRIGALDRCLEHPLQASGHFYCSIDGLFAPTAVGGK